jgi:hypothetical protein
MKSVYFRVATRPVSSQRLMDKTKQNKTKQGYVIGLGSKVLDVSMVGTRGIEAKMPGLSVRHNGIARYGGT